MLITSPMKPDRRFFAESFLMGAVDTMTAGGAHLISDELWILELS